MDRNRVKRLIRESYRLQKLPLQDALAIKGFAMHLFIIYTGKDLPGFNFIKEKTATVLQKLEVEILKQQS